MKECQKELQSRGVPYPRTCERCGLAGPCNHSGFAKPSDLSSDVLLQLTLELYARSCNVNVSREVFERMQECRKELGARLEIGILHKRGKRGKKVDP